MNTTILHNKEFDKLTKEQQRIAIAQDVLKQLNSKSYVAQRGNFLKIFKESLISDPAETKTLGDLLRKYLKPKAVCHVCALGSILVSQINVNGDCDKNELEVCDKLEFVTIYPFKNGSYAFTAKKFSSFILKYFTNEQLQMIEIAFERGNGAFKYSIHNWNDFVIRHGITISKDVVEKCVKFGHGYDNHNDRLLGIMNNVIENKGEFVP